MLYVYGVDPPDTETVAVPEAWQRLSVAVIELMTGGVAAGHWPFELYTHERISSMQSITGLRIRYIDNGFCSAQIIILDTGEP